MSETDEQHGQHGRPVARDDDLGRLADFYDATIDKAWDLARLLTQSATDAEDLVVRAYRGAWGRPEELTVPGSSARVALMTHIAVLARAR